MHAIFFDLETSDRNYVGQILNYSFVLVDQDYHILSELSGDVAISRLQLPDPEALLANRIKVLDHQRGRHGVPPPSERSAMRDIHEFITQSVSRAGGKLALIGFNSNRFDLPYLRTSLIRNGLNPYAGGKLLYRDLLLAARKLCATNDDFPRFARDEGGEKLSLSLENLAQRLGILSGKQVHHARADVLLSIELARIFRDRFKLDIATYRAYEVEEAKRGASSLVWQLYPNYDLSSSERATRSPSLLLSANYRYALWVDLDRYQKGEGRGSISWFNKNGSGFIFGGEISDRSVWDKTIAGATQEFKDLTPDNFFPLSSCDIEQDIYRLDMERIEALRGAIWEGNVGTLNQGEGRDARILYLRFLIREYEWGQGGSDQDNRMQDMLCRYALYRYGGKMLLSKGGVEEEGKVARYHLTLRELLDRLAQLAQEASSKGAVEDIEILSQLRAFYLKSDVYRLKDGSHFGEEPKIQSPP